MAEISTIARPYAEALFEVADQAGALSVWSERLGNLATAAENPDAQQLLGSPRVTATQLVEMFATFSGDGSPETKKFLEALAENKRLSVLPAVRDQFEVLKNARESTVDVRIESAFPLEGGELQALVVKLEAKFKRKVRPEVVVDNALIGGVKITAGDQVIDGSVRGKLTAMAANLASA